MGKLIIKFDGRDARKGCGARLGYAMISALTKADGDHAFVRLQSMRQDVLRLDVVAYSALSQCM